MPSLGHNLIAWNELRTKYICEMAGRNVFIRQKSGDLVFAGEFVANLPYLIELNKAAYISDTVNSIEPISTDSVILPVSTDLIITPITH